MRRLYYRSSQFGNEYQVLDEVTEEPVAIFFYKEDAIEYVNLKDTLRKCGVFNWDDLTDDAKKTFSGINDRLNK